MEPQRPAETFLVSETRPRRSVSVHAGLLIAAAVAVWVALFGCMRPHNEDDAWSLSCAYNYLHKGIARDFVYADGPAEGVGMGTELFGITHAYLYGAVLDRVGWSKNAAIGISAILMILALPLWYGTLRRHGYERVRALIFCGMMALAEPVVSAGQTARPDALAFLLVSLAVWLAAGERYLLAGVAAGLAFETHAMGLMAIPLVGAVVLASSVDRSIRPAARSIVRKAAPFVAGGLIALAYYLLLHGANLRLFALDVSAGNASSVAGDNALFRFFCTTRYFRNVPELILFVVCAALFVIRGRARERPFASWMFVCSLLAVVVLRRPNFFYALYFYPAFLLLLVEAGRSNRWLAAVAILWLGLALPRYVVDWRLTRHQADVSGYLAKVQKAVPADGLPVFGGVNDWFAFKEREFRATGYRSRVDRIGLREFYIVEDDDFRSGRCPALRCFLDARCGLVPQTTFVHDGEKHQVFKATVRQD
jgi:hypothetical protein